MQKKQKKIFDFYSLIKTLELDFYGYSNSKNYSTLSFGFFCTFWVALYLEESLDFHALVLID